MKKKSITLEKKDFKKNPETHEQQLGWKERHWTGFRGWPLAKTSYFSWSCFFFPLLHLGGRKTELPTNIHTTMLTKHREGHICSCWTNRVSGRLSGGRGDKGKDWKVKESWSMCAKTEHAQVKLNQNFRGHPLMLIILLLSFYRHLWL